MFATDYLKFIVVLKLWNINQFRNSIFATNDWSLPEINYEDKSGC